MSFGASRFVFSGTSRKIKNHHKVTVIGIAVGITGTNTDGTGAALGMTVDIAEAELGLAAFLLTSVCRKCQNVQMERDKKVPKESTTNSVSDELVTDLNTESVFTHLSFEPNLKAPQPETGGNPSKKDNSSNSHDLVVTKTTKAETKTWQQSQGKTTRRQECVIQFQ